ncbi:MAG: OadG family transporter subunit [Gammaproteobacteria bacterium]|nr:OadG family transporter subunit [Gammaproteobacteria bacterium]
MEQTDLMTEALNLTFFGMGFVFLFLTLLVFVTKFMSIVIGKIKKNSIEIEKNHCHEAKGGLNEEAKFVIEQAIKMHRGA